VLPDRRERLANGRPVKLSGRALGVLMTLIEAPGAAVSKEALMARVWSGRNIKAAQMAALRRLQGGAHADPHSLGARLSVHRQDPHSVGKLGYYVA
jgi:DNA-binding response OmpR family regulator